MLIQGPDLGLNTLKPDNLIDPRAASGKSQNVIYENGLMRTPGGFAKVDMTTAGLLNSGSTGDKVLSLFQFRELDNYTHFIAVTTDRIYEHDRVNEEWDNITQSGKSHNSSEQRPISYVEMAHSSSVTYNDVVGAGAAYYHCVVCDGGATDIQRWAGRYETDFADLVGAGGYHDGTTHRAWQVGRFKNRLILLSPQTYSSSTAAWTENNQTIQWPVVDKIETWTGTGSGSSTLIDTGGTNVWSAKLGGTYIIYQTMGIWDLNWATGAVAPYPIPVVPDKGLLAPHLLVSAGNVHYFLANDYNVYAYYGGTVIQRVGDEIRDLLQEQLEPSYDYKCWMSLGPDGKRLWIFIVPSGQEYITQAYSMDRISGAWSPHDYNDKWSDSGITAVSLIGAETYIVGDTYQEALSKISPYQSADDTATTAGDVTIKYGDVLRGDLTTNVVDWGDISVDFTNVAFSTGGLKFCFTTATNDCTQLVGDDTDYSNLVMRIDDGSDSSDMPNGSHYYTLTDVSIQADAAGVSCAVYIAPSESTATGAADASGDVPALAADTTATIFDPSGDTYRQKLDEVQVQDRMVIGDATGFIYRFNDETQYQDDSIMMRHQTKVFDMEAPGQFKRWPGIRVMAKEKTSGDGGLKVRYRTAGFDTSDTGWTDQTADLTSSWAEYTFWVNRSSKAIQYEFGNAAECNCQISGFEIILPLLESNR